MAFCSKCGAQLEEGAKFCPNCGAGIEEPAKAQEAPKAENNTANANQEAKKGFDINTLNDTPDTTADYAADDIEKNKAFALLSYIGILWLIPLLAAKESKFARFHANQGIVLTIVAVIGSFLNIIPILGNIAAALIGLACVVLMIIGILNACNGKAKELPIIGKFRILK